MVANIKEESILNTQSIKNELSRQINMYYSSQSLFYYSRLSKEQSEISEDFNLKLKAISIQMKKLGEDQDAKKISEVCLHSIPFILVTDQF